jgi:predicted AAA+ superfamily ATPase
MLERNISGKIKRCMSLFPVVVLTGARQSGKTTLARMLFPEWDYIDLERGSDFDALVADFDFFFKQHLDSLIIDEAQLSSELFRELRGIVDSDRKRNGRFLLTGSSSPSLARNISESLAGRVAQIQVGTLKMNERHGMALPDFYSLLDGSPVEEHLGKLRKLPVSLDTGQVLEHFLKGGYPELVARNDEPFHSEWMSQYEQTYIDRDIRKLFPGLNMPNYRRFIGMLAELSGTIINRSEIGRSLNVGESTVRDYLDIAQGTYLWRSLPSLERTHSKTIVKMPRGYVRDSGLLHHLSGVRDLRQLARRPGTGSAFEGFMIEEIIQGFNAIESIRWEYAFYRTRGGAEVDLVLTSPDGERIPVEIKYGASVRRAQLKSLSGFIEQEDCPYGILINNAEKVQMLTEKIIQIPAGCF